MKENKITKKIEKLNMPAALMEKNWFCLESGGNLITY